MYVNALREIGGPGHSRHRRQATPLAGNIHLPEQASALEGYKGATRLVADIPSPMQLPGHAAARCSMGSALYGNLHQIMLSATNGFIIKILETISSHFWTSQLLMF